MGRPTQATGCQVGVGCRYSRCAAGRQQCRAFPTLMAECRQREEQRPLGDVASQAADGMERTSLAGGLRPAHRRTRHWAEVRQVHEAWSVANLGGPIEALHGDCVGTDHKLSPVSDLCGPGWNRSYGNADQVHRCIAIRVEKIMKQQTLAVAADQSAQFEPYRRPTKREVFLDTMEKILSLRS